MSSILTSLSNTFWSIGIFERVLFGIGLVLLFIPIAMYIWSRFIKSARQKRQRNKEWLAINMPYLVELPITLAKANQEVTRVANALANKKVMYKTIEKCNKYHVEKVKAGLIDKPFSVSETVDIKTARRIKKKMSRKIGKSSKRIIETMDIISEPMEKNGIGLRNAINKDKEYLNYTKRLAELKAITNSNIGAAVSIYEEASYQGNMFYMFYSYLQKGMESKAKKERKNVPIEYKRPRESIRGQIDKYLDKLLSNVEDIIEESIDGNI